MNIIAAIETMRSIVDAYDRIEAKKLRIKKKTEKFLKGGKSMKFGTIIGIVVGVLALIASGAAAVYFLTKKKGCCEDCCDCCCDEDIFDEFPEEEFCCEEPAAEVPAEEDVKF